MDWEGKVDSPKLLCAATGTHIEPGATFWSALLFAEGQFVRRDLGPQFGRQFRLFVRRGHATFGGSVRNAEFFHDFRHSGGSSFVVPRPLPALDPADLQKLDAA